jgi:hypothetical protein
LGDAQWLCATSPTWIDDDGFNVRLAGTVQRSYMRTREGDDATRAQVASRSTSRE